MRPSGTPPWLPDWIFRLGTAAWVCDPGGKIAYANARAEELLVSRDGAWRGAACHALVRGIGRDGATVCRPGCSVVQRAERGEAIEPVTFRSRGAEGGPWIQVLVIALDPPQGEGKWLVHCASEVDRAQRIEEFLERVAFRSRPASERDHPAGTGAALTRREVEILGLLAADLDPKQIARRLHVSHATVRNHVQHLLAKLDVHSIEEAVAVHLLGLDAG